MIFPLILQTIIVTHMMSTEGEGLKWVLFLCQIRLFMFQCLQFFTGNGTIQQIAHEF